MARRKRAEPRGGHSPWAAAYGGVATLLLMFFVLLFSISLADAAKWENTAHEYSDTLAQAQKAASPAVPLAPEPSPAPPVESEAALKRREAFEALHQRMEAFIKENGQQDSFTAIRPEDDVLLLRAADTMLFTAGKAEITPDGAELLRAIGLLLDEYGMFISEIRVECHTDNTPMRGKAFESNWQFSSARAGNVVRFLLENSIMPPEKYMAAGFGEHRGVATNETEAGKAKNRRIDFVIHGLKEDGGGVI